MSKVRAGISMSLDGYVAGPDQSRQSPLGVGGEQLHSWVTRLTVWREQHGMEGGEENVSSAVVREATENVGAQIMGRGMFGPPEGGPADESWMGWWDEDPPFHMPVFVITHHEREPLRLSDTTFTFVTDGVESALAQARAAAGGKDVFIGGGASIINQYLASGALDELDVNLVPLLLGSGARLLEGVGPEIKLEQLRAIDAPGVTHIKYRVSN